MSSKIEGSVPGEAAAAARAESVTPVFKMKRTREELRLARGLLERKALTSYEEDEERVLSSEDTLPYAHEAMKEMNDVTEPGMLNCIEEAEDIQYGGVTLEHENKDRRRSDPPAYVVSHPWHIVDYHLYLCSAEKGQTLEVRRDSMYLFDGADCRPFPYEEFAEDRALISQCSPGDQPQLLFGILPIADRVHFAERNPSFGGRYYVLGFDYDCKTLYARRFDWFPHDLSDIWCVWDNGSNMYTTTVPDLTQIMDTSLGKGGMHVGMGILSSSPNCLALESDDDPGLEIIIATLWCQWLLDFSGILFKQNAVSLPDFQARLGSYVEQGRLILQRASYRAWFAVRDGHSKEQYKYKTMINQYTNDLYTFEKSEQDGSLKGQSWEAPGLETCNQIRYNERMQRKKRVEQRLEELFIVPETEVVQSQETVLQDILAKTERRSIDLKAINRTEIPRTPSPKSRQVSPVPSERCLSPGSPEIVNPATEPCNKFEVTGCHHLSFSMLLEQALEMVHANPELDTFANSDKFGDLLEEMGIRI
ncbi:hypothetical protein ASPVEDRAFT_37098 [Aspergillus versicolor CBS 583.65]|uniref:Uncharacterized protein n=1 Tax=Aspergillus versicolor CBS 583.65 TaxID=1036611 RepID=A0A1L9P8B3_ASPVE|nr:uncharacterized protein ASPVEDRAFT_37098 [Aspergillus versicolor CBS 583.65]OJI97674.1 hypothetical protein ASPVEDRAFT_37098 [Aspergillus versicolor CBS 583.65]